jgi:hypothetical protein
MRGFDIGISLYVRPVLREHSLTERIDFNLPLDLKTGAFKPKVKPSDTREQRANC